MYTQALPANFHFEDEFTTPKLEQLNKNLIFGEFILFVAPCTNKYT